MVMGARFAAWRASLGVLARLVVIAVLAAVAYGLVGLLHHTAAVPATDAILLALIVLCAAVVGFPFAAAAAILLAMMDYAARAGLHDGAAIPSAAVVAVAGLLLSPLFTTSPLTEADGPFYGPGQLAFGRKRQSRRGR